MRPRIPPLHAVTDDRILARPSFRVRAREVLAAGAGDLALHLRGPNSSGALLFELARALLPDARRAGARLLVNDRVDVALAAGVDGVHLGGRSIPASAARRILGPGPVVGVSVHDEAEAEEAVEEGADYLLVGTIFASPSHPERVPAGPELLRDLGRSPGSSGLPGSSEAPRPGPPPLIAIGGVEPGRVRELASAGARGVASVSAIWHAEEPGASVRALLLALSEARDRR